MPAIDHTAGAKCSIRVPEGQSSILAAEFIPSIVDDTGHLDDNRTDLL